jgi:tetratricopeptide (TPR) repeat protein
MLALVAEDRSSSDALAVQAARTLLDVQIAAGELSDAERTFEAQGERIAGEDRSMLRRRLARAWMRQGDLDRAARLIASDSTVDGFALAGHLALLRGDVAGARSHFQSAGPYAGTREEATIRTALLALLQPLEADTLPALGSAFLALERGDTAAAIASLDQAVRGLAPEKGSAQLGLLAAQLSWGAGTTADAERRLRQVAASEVAAAAPAAELDLARLLTQLRRPTEAIAQLEHLILTYPRSALIPQARRLLDEARAVLSTT